MQGISGVDFLYTQCCRPVGIPGSVFHGAGKVLRIPFASVSDGKGA